MYPLVFLNVPTRGLSPTPFLYRYAFQEEIGETGTPHLQGYLHYKNQVARSTLKQWNLRLHLEPARCSAQSVAYCTDPTKRRGRVWSKGFLVQDDLQLLALEDFHPWQTELLQELAGAPHPRRIIWYWDYIGGSGKTQLTRYILAKQHRVLFLSGGSYKDASYQVVKARQDPRIVLINLPRSAEGKISYGTFECLKDGLVQTGKYEGGVRLFAPPHLVVFANFLPDLAALSLDRWDVRHLDNRARIL